MQTHIYKPENPNKTSLLPCTSAANTNLKDKIMLSHDCLQKYIILNISNFKILTF